MLLLDFVLIRSQGGVGKPHAPYHHQLISSGRQGGISNASLIGKLILLTLSLGLGFPK